jgi:hypothetical protein
MAKVFEEFVKASDPRVDSFHKKAVLFSGANRAKAFSGFKLFFPFWLAIGAFTAPFGRTGKPGYDRHQRKTGLFCEVTQTGRSFIESAPKRSKRTHRRMTG